METNTLTNTGTGAGEAFQLRANQMFTTEAAALTLEDMLKEQDRRKYTLSRADIILICAVWGTPKDFYAAYAAYVKQCVSADYKYCQPPHYWLKYLLG